LDNRSASITFGGLLCVMGNAFHFTVAVFAAVPGASSSKASRKVNPEFGNASNRSSSVRTLLR
jgi:hypothetical protein